MKERNTGISRRTFIKELGVAALALGFPMDFAKARGNLEAGQEALKWEELLKGRYYYGFTVKKDIKFRLNPSEYGGKYYRFHPKGSLFRVTPAQELGWMELIKGDTKYPHMDSHPQAKYFLPLSELQLIDSDEASRPIDYVTVPENQHRKFVVLEKNTREASYMEGKNVILKLPVFLNDEFTPVGVYQILKRYLQTNMPSVDGVPFTNYFTPVGHALHGSPWRPWDTVKHDYLMRYDTHGCVNEPDWEATIGGYTLRADEFIFRWLGGQQHPESTAYEAAGTNAPHVIIVKELADLKKLGILPEMEGVDGFDWDRVTKLIKTKSLDAPDYFFTKE